MEKTIETTIMGFIGYIMFFLAVIATSGLADTGVQGFKGGHIREDRILAARGLGQSPVD